jgi:hypothetical protein
LSSSAPSRGSVALVHEELTSVDHGASSTKLE